MHSVYTQNCGVNLEQNYGVTFDLSQLTITSNDTINWYHISDNDGFDYYFNLCAPTITSPDPSCDSITSSYAFQIDTTNKNDTKCYHLSGYGAITPPIQYNLIDIDDPSFGITLTYLYGDYDNQCKNNRQLTLEFICDSDYYRNDYISMLSDAIIITGADCHNIITLQSVYGCPIQCKYGNNNKLCSSHGICGHDKLENTAKCFCYAGYSGIDCSIYLGTNEEEKDFNYDAGIDFNSPFIYKLYSELFGYNITYDLSFLQYGMGKKGYFVLKSNYNSYDPCYLYFNLINDTALDILQPIGVGAACNSTTRNDYVSIPYGWNHTFGYVYAQCPNGYEYPYTGLPDKDCDSYGRSLYSFDFYDKDEPFRGFTLKYIDGDNAMAFAGEFESIFNFICVDDYSKEIIDDTNGLNTYFNDKKYNFRYINTDNDDWIYLPNTVIVDIYTVAACPAHCVTIDDHSKSILELCHSNGICAFDPDINTVKCLCDGEDATDPIYCDMNTNTPTTTTIIDTQNPTQNPSIKLTQNPSMNPSKYPTQSPFIKSTQNPSIKPTQNPSIEPTQNPSKLLTNGPSILYSSSSTETDIENSIISTNINITISDNGKSKKSQDDNVNNKMYIIIITVVVIGIILIVIGVIIFVNRKKLKRQLSEIEANNNDENIQKQSMINSTDSNVDDMYKKITTQ